MSLPFQIRPDEELTELLDSVVRLAERAAGTKITRTSILRTAMTRGLVAMRKELMLKLTKEPRAVPVKQTRRQRP